MLSKVWSAAVSGVEGFLVGVELDLAPGLPHFTTVGLPDSSVREARERVVSALRNSGYQFPSRRVTVNLSPAQLRKGGTHFDLPIALGTLAASGQLSPEGWSGEVCALGELALDGSVRPVSGVLAMADTARRRGLKGLIVPGANAREARAAAGLSVWGVSSLREAAELLQGAPPAPRAEDPSEGPGEEPGFEDLSEVRGQDLARRALEIAAAGGHSLLMIGPPGSGKSMLARRLPGILPALSVEESVEVTRVYSVSGLLPAGASLLRRRPMRAPHHTATPAALIGGGARSKPGEAALAHHGVLFMDELPEFSRESLEALRQPLEDRRVAVTRLRETVVYPADFTWVAAMNPCPCGYLGHPARPCRCRESEVRRYRRRLSGPLLDRLDLQVEVAPLPFKEWAGGARGERSETVRERVLSARAAARKRGGTNARLPSRRLREECGLDAACLGLAESAASRFALSARSLDRLLRVARTIADLDGSGAVRKGHLAEGMGYLGKWDLP